jgi:hypothetical protein
MTILFKVICLSFVDIYRNRYVMKKEANVIINNFENILNNKVRMLKK